VAQDDEFLTYIQLSKIGGWLLWPPGGIMAGVRVVLASWRVSRWWQMSFGSMGLESII